VSRSRTNLIPGRLKKHPTSRCRTQPSLRDMAGGSLLKSSGPADSKSRLHRKPGHLRRNAPKTPDSADVVPFQACHLRYPDDSGSEGKCLVSSTTSPECLFEQHNR
jgi:hypothetical protein